MSTRADSFAKFSPTQIDCLGHSNSLTLGEKIFHCSVKQNDMNDNFNVKKMRSIVEFRTTVVLEQH